MSNIGLIRIIKTIRLFKLLRFLKLSTFFRSALPGPRRDPPLIRGPGHGVQLGKFPTRITRGPVRRMLNERLDVYPVTLRLSKIVTVLLLAMHLFACAFWRLKYETSQDALHEFLASRGLSGDVSLGSSERRD